MQETVELHYERRGEARNAGPALLILHGLFGSSVNWRSFARRLAFERVVYSVDLRNHGRSPHARPHDCEAMAADCERFLRETVGGAADVLGHSMGGRVAMHLALSRADLVRRLVVVDISPRPGAAAEPRSVLAALLSVDPGLYQSRIEVGKALESRISDPALRAWLLLNLKRRADGRQAWRFGLAEIAASFESLGASLPAGRRFGPCLFVRGASSGYLPVADEPVVREIFPDAEIVTIANAGHMPHIDAPEELAARIERFLSAGEPQAHGKHRAF